MQVIRRLTSLSLFFALLQTGPSAQTAYNVRDYGAQADGTTLTTKAIQAAIDACHQNGGGQVVFPAGQYLSGTIVLKDNVYLALNGGATLLGSKNIADYEPKYLVFARDAKNIGLLGPGLINGQGDAFWRDKERPYIRPERTIELERCNNVLIRDLQIRNSAAFNIALEECDRVTIAGVSIVNDRNAPNTDGIDPISSSNVFISDCYIETGDDAICPKSHGTAKPCENLVVANCVLISDDSAIKCGTRSDGAIRHCSFSNIVIRDAKYGIAFYMKDGGVFEDIQFSNISIETTRRGIERSFGTNSYAVFMDIEKREPSGLLGRIRNIVFSDIRIATPDGNCLLAGMPEQKIENVAFDNVQMRVTDRTDLSGRRKPRGTRSLTDRAANDCSAVMSHWTFAHIDGLTLRNFIIQDETDSAAFERHGLWALNVDDFSVDGFHIEQAQPNTKLAMIHLQDCRNARLEKTKAEKLSVPFVQILGKATRRISLINNDWSLLAKPLAIGKEIKSREIFQQGNRVE
ncbi:MAG TPA: glycosyl hydrolase family 28 protein [bacterium]|nr:glycosyl hydrolase family 28 protein [bacterium]HPN36698.1 glycosyl hydrolase family 28 protein [bacterium]